MEGEDNAVGQAGLFKDPEGYYQLDKPATFTTHALRNGRKIQMRLVGHNPLWGHLLWNAGQVITDYVEDNTQILVKGKNVLELGAGAGLPSLVCAALGAQKVVVTDYPDPDLIENLRYNIDHCDLIACKASIVAEGYLWGSPVNSLQVHLAQTEVGFDILILADILFNHSEHKKLVATVQATLKKEAGARALVFFTPYRPWLLEKDMHFFDLAKAGGFTVELIVEKRMEKVMFENDPGDELMRRTVFGYQMKWNL